MLPRSTAILCAAAFVMTGCESVLTLEVPDNAAWVALLAVRSADGPVRAEDITLVSRHLYSVQAELPAMTRGEGRIIFLGYSIDSLSNRVAAEDAELDFAADCKAIFPEPVWRVMLGSEGGIYQTWMGEIPRLTAPSLRPSCPTLTSSAATVSFDCTTGNCSGEMEQIGCTLAVHLQDCGQKSAAYQIGSDGHLCEGDLRAYETGIADPAMPGTKPQLELGELGTCSIAPTSTTTDCERAPQSCPPPTCESGRADCNGVASDGCEADLSSDEHCGACDQACQPPWSVCQAGHCNSWVELALDYSYGCGRLASGRVACWGLDNPGSAGTSSAGASQRERRPVLVDGIEHATQLVVDTGDACIIDSQRKLWCWHPGRDSPQLIEEIDQAEDVALSGGIKCVVLSSGGLTCLGWNTWSPGFTHRVQRIATDHNRSWCTILEGFGVKCWDQSRQTIEFPNLSGTAEQIIGGLGFFCARLASGDVQCWGITESGVLGTEDQVPSASPITIPGLDRVSLIAANDVTACALKVSGAVLCWGENEGGILQRPGMVRMPLPMPLEQVPAASSIALGPDKACAVGRDDVVRCWGSNVYGHLGVSNEIPLETSHRPVLARRHTSWQQLLAGASDACAVTDAGRIVCWGTTRDDPGSEYHGPYYSENPVELAELEDVVEASASGRYYWLPGDGFFKCARTRQGRISCWGDNSMGQLGIGNTDHQPGPVEVAGVRDAVEIAVGGHHACAVKSDGALLCWGDNSFGQLGFPRSSGRPDPHPLPGLRAEIPRVVHACASDDHTCVLTESGDVICWGWVSAAAPIGPTKISGLAGAAELVCGELFTCARMNDGTVRCWGVNSWGQLGDGTITDNPSPVEARGLTHVLQLSASREHTCAVRASGEVACWGDNSLGECGAPSDRTEVLEPTVVPGLPPVAEVTAGVRFTCARTIAGDVDCWGVGDGCQLGRCEPWIYQHPRPLLDP